MDFGAGFGTSDDTRCEACEKSPQQIRFQDKMLGHECGLAARSCSRECGDRKDKKAKFYDLCRNNWPAAKEMILVSRRGVGGRRSTSQRSASDNIIKESPS